MTWNTLYLILNALVMPAWALLLLLPRAHLTARIVHSALYPVVIGAIYAVSLAAGMVFGQSADGVGFSSLARVALLFDHPNGVITGWSHYLVFDLFVGAWIGRDAVRRGIAHIVAVPCLLGTYLFGPVGLLLYVVVRAVRGGGLSLAED